MIPALYGIAAHRVEDGKPVELLACASVFDLADLPVHLEEFTAKYADRDDVLLELDTTPTC